MNRKKSKKTSPRIKIIQKIYNALMNPNTEIEYPKSQYKKFIKDVVTGTLERIDLIEETVNENLSKDIDLVFDSQSMILRTSAITSLPIPSPGKTSIFLLLI